MKPDTDIIDTTQAFVIRGAEVIDGSGAPRFEADVVVRGGLIDAIVPPGSASTPQVLDGSGLILCPGFIDTHSHDDLLVLQATEPHPKLAQGVCTVVTGNCGISLAPLLVEHPPAPLDLLDAEGAPRLADFRDYLARLDATPLALNVVPLIGHSNLRLKHLADLQRPADAAQVDAMRDEVSAALDAGGFGLSTGVYYPPARAATTAELIGVSAALQGRPGAVLAMHLRDEADHIDAAIAEALEVGASNGATLVLSHHKVMGRRNHGRTRQTLQAIETAAGLQSVCIDCYPYAASSTMLRLDRIADSDDVLITTSVPHPEQGGRRLAAIAADWGVPQSEAAQRLMPGGAVYFALAESDVERVLVHPLAMIGSDGLPHDRHPHPRLWGSFPRVLGHYSRERGLLPLESAVHKMTGLPARRFGLADRGRVAVGQAADLVLFDAARVRDAASYEAPAQAPEGIHAVLVNGRLAQWQGRAVDRAAGRRLTRQRDADKVAR
ncbi:D-aminoacylase [Aquincola sp. S2]|uniref:D-aminoacylase n=1 Tax=Pseudaquabacterium terrae TaxID=2732868 RepID=A0ABX2EEH5_9BURK|nr:D-aminoacylase [Aquabacterium terrae]NRF67015.1 D-aminoacylase [Aquabacterium terrae]